MIERLVLSAVVAAGCAIIYGAVGFYVGERGGELGHPTVFVFAAVFALVLQFNH